MSSLTQEHLRTVLQLAAVLHGEQRQEIVTAILALDTAWRRALQDVIADRRRKLDEGSHNLRALAAEHEIDSYQTSTASPTKGKDNAI